MNDRQIKILKMLSEIVKPKEEHVNKLRKICEDETRTVAKDFLLMYEAELSQYKELQVLLMQEFMNI